jgi:hypothetical protein
VGQTGAVNSADTSAGQPNALEAGALRLPALSLVATDDPPALDFDAATVMTTCANCGARMIERKCKLICSCGYFLSCSDYY